MKHRRFSSKIHSVTDIGIWHCIPKSKILADTPQKQTTFFTSDSLNCYDHSLPWTSNQPRHVNSTKLSKIQSLSLVPNLPLKQLPHNSHCEKNSPNGGRARWFLFPLPVPSFHLVLSSHVQSRGRDKPISGRTPPSLAMSGPPPSLETSYASPPTTIILTVVLLVFFLVGFFSIFFCKCLFENLFGPWNLRQSPSADQMRAAGANDGLDPSLIQAFPTFVYSTIKDFRQEKYGLECAICLAEFEDDSVLRLLTVCYHVFHQECIDLWLTSHKTCPVCRGNLDLPLSKLSEMDPVVAVPRDSSTAGSIHENEEAFSQGAVSINIKEGEDGEYRGGGSDPVVITVQEHGKMEKFPRSHSTGHSIARNKVDEDKYRLKLQDHVKIQIDRGHTGSCITFGEFSDHEDMMSNGAFNHVPGNSMHQQQD